MFRKWFLTFCLLVLMLSLAACGAETPADLATVASEATVAPAIDPTAAPPTDMPPTEPQPTVEAATAEPEASAEATTEPVAAVLCPEVARPAVVVTTGASFCLHVPLGGTRCVLPRHQAHRL